MELFAADGKEVKPGVLSAEKTIACHHGAERAQGETIAAKTRGDELLLRAFTDEREPVVGLDHLSKPAVPQLRLGDELLQHALKPVEHFVRIFFLPGLAVQAAEDGVAVVWMLVDPQIVIWVAGVPEKRLGQRFPRQPGAENVTGIESELGLKQCRPQSPGFSHQRVVRRNDQVAAANSIAVGMDSERIGLDIGGFTVFKNEAALARNGAK